MRCVEHTDLIAQAEKLVELDDDKGIETLIAARALAGECDECGGWGVNGQRIELVDMTGLDVAMEMVKCHRLTLGHLGLTTKRHFYATPCPAVNANGHYCGQFKVGRNDGESRVTCSACKANGRKTNTISCQVSSRHRRMTCCAICWPKRTGA